MLLPSVTEIRSSEKFPNCKISLAPFSSFGICEAEGEISTDYHVFSIDMIESLAKGQEEMLCVVVLQQPLAFSFTSAIAVITAATTATDLVKMVFTYLRKGHVG